MAIERIKAPTKEQLEAELAIAKARKGDNWVTMCAMVSPKSYVTFAVRQSMVAYYGLKREVDPAALLWLPRQATENATKVDMNGTEGHRSAVLVPHGKLIRIPTNPAEYPADKIVALKGKKGAEKAEKVNRKFYYFRIPPCMSLNAVSLMINQQFTKNKPTFFVTANGNKHFVVATFKEASKLKATGYDTNKPRNSLPVEVVNQAGDNANAS